MSLVLEVYMHSVICCIAGDIEDAGNIDMKETHGNKKL
jgi:hypothetical protein